MKLWQKLSLLTVCVLLLTGIVSGGVVIHGVMIYNQSKTMENYEQQIKSTAFALGRELQSSPFESYQKATKISYLKYLIRRYDASEYILIEDDHVICNETAFHLTDPSDARWGGETVFSVIQQKGSQYILLAGKRIPLGNISTNLKLVLVKDISSLYQNIRSQAFFLCVDISKHDNCCGCACFYNNWKNFKAAAGIAEGCTGYSKGQSNTAGRCAQQR